MSASMLLLFIGCCFAFLFLGNGMRPVNRADGICVELVRPHGFHCEEYMIQTQDGYLLGIQRISSPTKTSRKSDKTNVPVILYHGIDNGGDIWLLSGPKQSLAFILASSHHDVWIPNTRTSTFSYGHTSLNSSNKEFWNWSLDELVNFDLPAVVNEVISKVGGEDKVHFVAYSQSSQALFGAFSEGKLVDKIAKAVMVAPVAYVSHTTSPLATIATRFNLGLVLVGLNVYEFNPRSNSGNKILEVLCTMVDICESDLLSLITGPNCCVDDTRMDFINHYELQPTSVKNWNHLGQMYQKKSFTKFDYGEQGNQRFYGTKTVPKYDISKVSSDISMMLVYGGKDALADPQDVKMLLGELRKPPKVLFLPHYAHFDFVLGTNAYKDIYRDVISFLNS